VCQITETLPFTQGKSVEYLMLFGRDNGLFGGFKLHSVRQVNDHTTHKTISAALNALA
jgi:hypothetical protein